MFKLFSGFLRGVEGMVVGLCWLLLLKLWGFVIEIINELGVFSSMWFVEFVIDFYNGE